MSGHVYSRAFQAHLLASAALTKVLSDDSSVLMNKSDEALNDLLTKNIEVEDVVKQYDVLSMTGNISSILNHASEKGHTIKLWTLYLRLTHILRLFIFAERTGNFLLHLHRMELFIPIFHSTGNFPYVKSTRINL